MSTHLELDISSVNLDTPWEEQKEVLSFLGNPQPDNNETTLSTEIMCKLLEISKNILKNENPNWRNTKILASLACTILVEVGQDNEKVLYKYRQGFSDSDRLFQSQWNIQSQSVTAEELDLFNKIIDWVVQGIFYLYQHLAEVSSDCLDCEFETDFKFFSTSCPNDLTSPPFTTFSILPKNFTGISNRYHYCNGEKNKVIGESGYCVRCSGGSSCSCK